MDHHRAYLVDHHVLLDQHRVLCLVAYLASEALLHLFPLVEEARMVLAASLTAAIVTLQQLLTMVKHLFILIIMVVQPSLGLVPPSIL